MKTADIQVTYINHMGDDLTVVNAARVSFDKESDWGTFGCFDCGNSVQYACSDKCSCIEEGATKELKLKQSDAKLIAYLADHKHFSPFNHAFLSFRVKAPLYVARQLVKHKFLPWNEVSRRYVDFEPEFYVPKIYRAKGENVKQGSAEVDSGFDPHAAIEFSQICLDEYNSRLAHGVCPEQARDCLPVNSMTEWIWSGSLGAFLDMLILRLDPHTQLESRIVAQQIAEHVKALFPVSYKARIND